MLNIFFRLIEEGYTPRENDGQRFSQRHVSEAVQTLNLKQVAELAAADYIKVDILHFPANIKKKDMYIVKRILLIFFIKIM